MAKNTALIEPRLPRGFVDSEPGDLAAIEQMVAKIRHVYERYGFDPLQTPFLEYTETLGKFLPDTDRPNAGVFSVQDDDDQWMSLRYDLTAPLARYFAQNYQDLPKPFRSYRQGWVFRNEKPGPGRFRQFMQFDADTVGAAGPEADAEICMMMADTMDALGLAGKYVVRVNNRKVLDGVMQAIGVTDEAQKLTVLRAIDKLDKFGPEGVRLLLGEGRKDESGDFTEGAGLSDASISLLLEYVQLNELLEKMFDEELERFPLDEQRKLTPEKTHEIAARVTLKALDFVAENNPGSLSGVEELKAMSGLFYAAGYGPDRIKIDPSVVRGLEYYTGPVFEIELTFKVQNEKGQDVVFGSVGGGGRYDGLVSRFRNEETPATGFSIGVSRLASALKLTGNLEDRPVTGPVVVTVMEKDRIADYQKMVADLRNAGIRAELFLGSSKNMGKQMKYADKRNAPAVIIQGSDEREQGIVQIKDLAEGAEAAASITDNAAWKTERPGQYSVPREQMVDFVKQIPAVAAWMKANG
ncbi:histidine--tRNA ligase [Pelagibacterium sp. H642]|uniref:histidine--tRNA ligase n=1 Tax=Pelagibacterium sp. H642 TaxID=1881069 RepID=UPI002814A7AA|nr:histidine--tRNA ligase [Pelagibacterium sp. H642]WMT91440.1 histidine--tRNA ligase [Pelagibacterium sp. H642]